MYTKEERLEIGRRLYEDELTRDQAAEEYEISEATARNYMRQYRDAHQLPPKRSGKSRGARLPQTASVAGLEEIEAMSREELIDALIMARINEVRLKKGYTVKGVGARKEFVPISSKNTK